MLSYQHAYHAGGPADIHKHMVLAEIVAALTRKTRGISYAETHAGRGLYDVESPEAIKTGEAADGIARLDLPPASPFGRALQATKAAHGDSAYPGSPLVAAALLRDVDRMTLMELHPAEHNALTRAMAGSGAQIHKRNGLEGILALAPLNPRKGLVLVDPSYEIKSEYAQIGDFATKLIRKWPQATILIWYPLLPAGRHMDLHAALDPLPHLVDEMVFTPPPTRGMFGSGLVLINAPHQVADLLAAVHEATRGVLKPVT